MDKKVIINHIRLENYANLKVFDADLADLTIISGRNGTGKTTIANAIAETITGKMLDGTEPNGIRPHDAKGEDIHRVPIVRELTLTIDGKTHTIRKVTEEVYKRPRGGVTEEFNGNKTYYVVDGFDTQPTKFTEWVTDNIGKPEVILNCMNANTFLNLLRKSTVSAREYLEKTAGFDMDSFIANNPQYAEVGNILNGHTVEETMKQLNKQKLMQSKTLETVKTNLSYETDRKLDLEEIEDTAQYDKELKELEQSEAVIRGKVEEKAKLVTELALLERKRNEAVKDDAENINARIATARNVCNAEVSKKIAVEEDARRINLCYEQDKQNVERITHGIENLKEQLNATVNMTVDEGTFICPTCGQMLPLDKIANIKEDFETRKSNRIGELKVYIENEEKRLVEYKCRIANEEKQLKENAEILELAVKKIDEAKRNYEALSSMNPPASETVIAIEKQIADMKAKIEAMPSYDGEAEALRQRRAYINSCINNAEIKKKANEAIVSGHDVAVSNLTEQMKKEAQALAYIERNIDTLKSFSISKNDALAQLINPHFKAFHFEFMAFTQEGNPYEVCNLIDNETATSYFNGLNTSSQLLVQLDLLNGLQELNGVNLPLILDQVESINRERIPKYDRQLICLEVSEDKELTVKGA